MNFTTQQEKFINPVIKIDDLETDSAKFLRLLMTDEHVNWTDCIKTISSNTSSGLLPFEKCYLFVIH